MEALVEAVAARHPVRLSDRRDARRRRRDPDLPQLLRRAEALVETRRSSARARSKAWPGPEAANNASAAGVLVPMLTLGLPTSATAAIMLSAFQSYGINPGPLLLESQPHLVWGLIAVALHRQRDAPGAQPAADRDLGAAPANPGAAALRRHPRVRDHRHLRHHPVAGRPRPALSRRRHRATSCAATTSRPRR